MGNAAKLTKLYSRQDQCIADNELDEAWRIQVQIDSLKEERWTK